MKNVLITGTNRGIGKQLVNDFAKHGYRVYAHARCDSEEFRDFVKILNASGYEVHPLFFDLNDYDSMKHNISELNKNKTYMDVLINNAGVAHGGLFSMTTTQTIKEVFNVNLFSPMELTRLVLRGMMRNQSGVIINIASIAGLDLHEGNSAYGVSKAAVIAWTKTLAAEITSFGIRVNAIAPGLTDTDMAKQMESKASVQMVNESAMKRLARPEEISNIAIFLASESASFVNGQVIRVDGGGK